MSHWKNAARSVVRRPAFTITTVTVLAFGIAANSALFSVVDTVLLKPLPYPQPDRLVVVMEANASRGDRRSLIAPARIEDWNRLAQSFEAISGHYAENVTDTSMSEPERLSGRRVAARFFDVFGRSPLIGRTFHADEERHGGPQAAVISERLWTRRYNRDPGVLGRRLILSGIGYTIVGVMPGDFGSPAIEVWLPAQLSPFLAGLRDERFFSGVARMKPGFTIEQAAADLERVCRDLGEQYPKTDKGWSALVTDYREALTGSSSRALGLMFGAVALLLLILCANISGLLLGQLQRRERELAIRTALGASRSQIAAVVLREVALLAGVGGALGLVLALLGTRVVAGLFADLPRLHELQFDWRSGLFTAAVAGLTALVFGLVPAWQATRRDVNVVLSRGGRSQAGGRHRSQQVLVGVQFAVTLVLLAGAGLLFRSYLNLTRVQPGFRAEQVLLFHVGAEWGEDRDKLGLLQQQLVEQLGQLRGVEAAGVTNFLPASDATLRAQVRIEGLAHLGDEGKISVGGRMVSEGYLRALKVPLLQGSSCPEFRHRPDLFADRKVLVNRRFAELAGGDVVGRQIVWDRQLAARSEILGVVGDVKEDGLSSAAAPYVYTCLPPGGWPDPEYVLGLKTDPREVMPAVREVVRRLAPQRAIFGVSTLSERLDRTLERPRVNAGLLGVFAGGALVTAALGLYGLMMLVVAGRSREIGIRIALGALPGQITRQVILDALRPLWIAIAGGGMAALLVLRSLRQVLFEVSPADAVTLVCVCGLLVVVAAASAALPARRAARIDPVAALRSE